MRPWQRERLLRLGDFSGVTPCLVSLSKHTWVLYSCVTYLRLLWELEGVYAISEVGSECVVQLAQRFLQRLERLFVLLQCLQLLLEANLPVQCLNEDAESKSWVLMFHSQEI